MTGVKNKRSTPPSRVTSPSKRNLLDLAPTKANSVIADIFLLYSGRYAGWLPVASLVPLLADLGVTETNTRATLHRLAKSDMLARVARRHAAGYEPTGAWGALLPEGQRYLQQRLLDQAPSISAGWVLVNFSFPESARADRHLLRTLLTRHGFGCVSSGLWIFPGGEMERVVQLIRALGFEDHVVIFSAEHRAFGPVRELVERAWPLETIAASFAEFVERYDSIDLTSTSPQSDFVTFTLAHNHFRHLGGICPALPHEVLPADWPGGQAVELMRLMTRNLRAGAEQYADSVIAAKFPSSERKEPKR